MRSGKHGARAAAALVGVAALAGAAVVSATAARHAGKVRSIATLTQPRRTAGPLDLASVSFGQDGPNLTLTVRTRGAWTPATLAADPGRRLCLDLFVGAASSPRAEACVAARRRLRAGELALQVTRFARPRPGPTIVTVPGGRPDARSVRVTLDPAIVGLGPGRYRWQVVSSWSAADGCPALPATRGGPPPAAQLPPGACLDSLPFQGPVRATLVATRMIGCTRRGPAVVYNGSRARREVALAFDDGPWADTPRVLDVLEANHVPATFFMIGVQVAGHGALLRRELRDGDALGNHTWSHPDLVRSGGAAGQLARTSAAIERASGYRPCLFRPPGGSYDGAVVNTALAGGMTTVMWDVDPRDWSRPGTAAIEQNVLANARSGSILELHDGGGPRAETIAALPAIIHALKRRGLRFVTLPELLGYRPLYGRWAPAL